MKLVSINIPTFNSEKTIGDTLYRALDQSYQNIEVIVMDSYSNDKTTTIAKNYGVKVVMCKGRLLEARIAGVNASNGEYVLFLDSDQILERTAIERAVEKIKDYDYLWLYERSQNKGFIPSLYDADRILTQKYLDEKVVCPRFFKKKMLLEAIKSIPKEHIHICGAQDHEVVFYEIKQLSKRMGGVENAVWHIEPDNLIKLFKKQYRWGKTTRDFYDTGVYRELITVKNRFRGFYFSHPILSFKSFVLRVLRGIPYAAGFYFGVDNQRVSKVKK